MFARLLLSLSLFAMLTTTSTAQPRPPQPPPQAIQPPPAPASQPGQPPQEQAIGKLETVATFNGPMPTGVTVSQMGRVFVNFPHWGDEVEFTVAEVKQGQATAYPNAQVNKLDKDRPAECLVSVQSVVVDPADRLWMLDTGSVEFGPTMSGGPKLVGVDLKTNKIFKTIAFDRKVALETTYLNDLRFDLRQGKAGVAYITDSSDKGPNAIIVVDLDSGASRRVLNDHSSTKADKKFLPFVEGRSLMQRKPGQTPQYLAMGADGIAISADGSRLFYCPLASRKLYSVSTAALRDEKLSEADVAETVMDEGMKPASDGLESDAAGGVYCTAYEQNAIMRRDADGAFTTVAHDPRMLWPDTMSVAMDGYLYFTANQLHRQPNYHAGEDQRMKPYSLFRVKIDHQPVLLK